jgi:hypothetical protein
MAPAVQFPQRLIASAEFAATTAGAWLARTIQERWSSTWLGVALIADATLMTCGTCGGVWASPAAAIRPTVTATDNRTPERGMGRLAMLSRWADAYDLDVAT